MCKVFFEPGQLKVIDYARQIGPNAYIAVHSGLMLVELKLLHPRAVLAEEEEFLQELDKAHSTKPKQTTGARFDYSLSRRQTIDYQSSELGESFKVAQEGDNAIVSVFARCNGAYWTFKTVATLPHSIIMQRCLQAFSWPRSA